MYISIGSDHRGVAARLMIAHILKVQGDDIYSEYGPSNEKETWDYPFPAFQVALDVSERKAERGILICGSGMGVTIAANKVDGVRAALCRTADDAVQCREHADCNVLCLGEECTKSVAELNSIIEAFLFTEFSNEERHRRRVNVIRSFEEYGEEVLDGVPAEESVIREVEAGTHGNKFYKPMKQPTPERPFGYTYAVGSDEDDED
jgi:RpiB/LacA/LacB family sugar-phosphate isomerase